MKAMIITTANLPPALPHNDSFIIGGGSFIPRSFILGLCGLRWCRLSILSKFHCQQMKTPRKSTPITRRAMMSVPDIVSHWASIAGNHERTWSCPFVWCVLPLSQYEQDEDQRRCHHKCAYPVNASILGRVWNIFIDKDATRYKAYKVQCREHVEKRTPRCSLTKYK